MSDQVVSEVRATLSAHDGSRRSLTELFREMRPEERQRFASQVMEALGRTGSEREKLWNSICRAAYIKGMRLSAQRADVEQAIVRALLRTPVAGAATLRAWVIGNPHALAAAQLVLDRAGVKVSLPVRFSHTWSQRLGLAMLSSLAQLNDNEVPVAEVSVALLCLLNLPESPPAVVALPPQGSLATEKSGERGRDMEEVVAPGTAPGAVVYDTTSDPIKALLGALEAEPSSSPIWDERDGLLNRLDALFKQKLAERQQAGVRRRVQVAIEALAHHRGELEYLELEGTDRWALDDDAADLDAIAAWLDRLGDLLGDLSKLRALKPSHMREERELRARQDKQIEQICAIHTALSKTLSVADAVKVVSAAEEPAQEGSAASLEVALLDDESPPEIQKNTIHIDLTTAEVPPQVDHTLPLRATEDNGGPPTRQAGPEAAPQAAASEVVAPEKEPINATSLATSTQPPPPTPPLAVYAEEPKPSEPQAMLLSDVELLTLVRQGILGQRPQEARLLQEAQRRALLGGDHIRAFALARCLEAMESAGEHIESWLCLFAASVMDPLAFGEAEREQLLAALLGALALPERSRMFAFTWGLAALLGSETSFALRVGAALRQVPAPSTSEGSVFFHFCVQRLLEPAQRNQRPKLSTSERTDEEERRYRSALDEAMTTTELGGASYKNRMVKQVWRQLVQTGGPLSRVIEQARREPASFPSPTQTAEQLAMEVPEFACVVADYRQNILHRVESLLVAVRRAETHYRAAQRLRGSSEIALSAREVQAAVEDGRALAARHKELRHPWAFALDTIVTRMDKINTQENG